MNLKMMKKLIFALLLVCVVAVVFPLPADAAEIVDSGEWGQEGSDVRWTLDSNGVLTVFGTGKMWDCYDYGDNWFRVWDPYMQDIREVVICDGITYIGDDSFSGAGNLKSVTIADSVEEIGRSAFANCDSLTDISFGSGLVRAGISVFYDCDALTSFTFPQTETTYGSDFLADCDNLKNITLSDKMDVLIDRMFGDCTSLESITIPAGVTEIGGAAFEGCIALQHVEIPKTVTVIHDNAFAFCNALEMLTLPDSLQKMGNSVFDNCLSLKEITVPVNVSQMAHTFECAYGLESVTFTGNAPICGGNLFGNITVTACYPDNNKTWTETVRQDYGGTVTWKPYQSDLIPNDVIASGTCGDNLNWVLRDAYTLIISGAGDMFGYGASIPWADYSGRIESVIIEPGVTSVGYGAFSDCRVLRQVSIADTVTLIDQSSFHNCVQLLELTIPESVRTIDYGAFSGCISLEQVAFSGDAPAIGDYAFSDVTTTVYYPGSNRTWKSSVRQDYGGSLTWVSVGHVHEDTVVITPPTCTEEGFTTYTCACGDVHIDDRVPAKGHTYESGTCSVCGEENSDYNPAKDPFTLYGANMTLGNNLAMNFYIDPAYLPDNWNYYAVITKEYADRKDLVLTVEDVDWEKVDGKYRITLDKIAAKEMADTITVAIYNDRNEAVSKVWEDSVRDYTMRMLNKDTNTENRTLYVEMLNYGAAAQEHFNYNVEDLANNQLTDVQKTYGLTGVAMEDSRIKGSGYVGTSLTLESNILMNFYFDTIPADHQDMYAIAAFTDHYGKVKEVRVEGKDFVQFEETTWKLSVAGLVIADCRQPVAVSVYNAEGEVIAGATDSIESYTARMDNDGPLYVAIMKFAVAAYNSFH